MSNELATIPNEPDLRFSLDVRGSEGITMEEGWSTGDMTQKGLEISTVYYADARVLGGCIDRQQTKDLRDFLNRVLDKCEKEL